MAAGDLWSRDLLVKTLYSWELTCGSDAQFPPCETSQCLSDLWKDRKEKRVVYTGSVLWHLPKPLSYWISNLLVFSSSFMRLTSRLSLRLVDSSKCLKINENCMNFYFAKRQQQESGKLAGQTWSHHPSCLNCVLTWKYPQRVVSGPLLLPAVDGHHKKENKEVIKTSFSFACTESCAARSAWLSIRW